MIFKVLVTKITCMMLIHVYLGINMKPPTYLLKFIYAVCDNQGVGYIQMMLLPVIFFANPPRNSFPNTRENLKHIINCLFFWIQKNSFSIVNILFLVRYGADRKIFLNAVFLNLDVKNDGCKNFQIAQTFTNYWWDADHKF